MKKEQSVKRKIAIIDAETDPFKFGRVPKPFCWGFFDGEDYRYFWDSFIRGKLVLSATQQLLDFLESYETPLTIYAHNGGKFDFLFFIEKFRSNIRIVNGRILEAKFGIHTFRDSYAILPISLGSTDAGKLSIDYKLMEKEYREKFKPEILEYLEADCKSLHKLVMAFIEEFGDILTIGSASMKQFKKYHKFENLSQRSDKFLREFYFGGRCQCFETGIIEAPIKVFDVHSMYPDTMLRKTHPVSASFEVRKKISEKTFFVEWEGWNFNAVPRRMENGSLDFSIESGIFKSSIHEFNRALEYDLIICKRIIRTIDFDSFMTFENFVTYFYESRLMAQKHGDKFLALFYKLILNSSYGKLAQCSDDFVDSIILPWGEIPDDERYYIEYRHDEYAIWSKPAERHSYYNVATAASITGGARATLLDGFAHAIRPLYCDTDSIFCVDLKPGVEIDDKKLGSWGLEKTGDCMAIAGKKLYALLDGDVCVKKASKGSNLPPMAIFDIARGETVETRNDAPTFKLGVPADSKRIPEHVFIERKIRRTGKQKALA